ncbi:MAG: hypothetical protein HYV09_14075 [Deltaproteobacteria bacterium]|nr:hypothetical protein [Deltaproteobacteria bacterium]
MYSLTLTLHSHVRWLVLIAGAIAVFVASRGWLRRQPWPTSGKVPALLVFLIAVDLQLLLGVVAYATSPLVGRAHAAMGAAMRDPTLRFWAVEHAFAAVIGVVLVHVGYALAKRGDDATARFRRAALFSGFALLSFLVATPWPWRAVGRPLFGGM